MSPTRSHATSRPAAFLRQGLLALALTTALGGGLFAPPAHAEAAKATKATATVDIPYEEFTLPNGLRVIVHTDRKAPIVAVNIWYHVGSLDEPKGRTGFAHLFEHLMFNGSENHPGEFFDPFEKVGATNMNGTTNSDRTNYFQNVPTTALDMALWMESDRMGHLLGAIDQKTLDEQRGVVQNEKRQGENQPYGQVYEVMTKALYPAGHPYSHTVIGSMADLNAASLEDVKNWFRTWYGPNNAVLVLAGDIDVETAKQKVAKYFGDIPASPTMSKPTPDIVTLDAPKRIEMQDNVPQVRIYRGWNIAKYGDPDVERMQLFAQVLGGSKSSRLDQRLLHQDKLVDSISASASASQLDGGLMIVANVRKGVDPALVEKAIDEEVAKLLRDGPTASELEQARTVFKAGFIRGIERIGGFGGKADALAECAVYTGNPGCFRDSLRVIETASRDEILATAHRWLDKGSLTLVVSPGERTPLPEDPAVTPASLELPPVDAKFTTLPSDIDRSKGVPSVDTFPELTFPALQRAKLSNGSTLILAERHDIPVVQVSYEFGGGYASDPKDKLGVANFAMGMLDEGEGDLGALEFANRAESLGASLGASASLDGSSAYLSAIKDKLRPSLQLFADMLRQPRFEQAEIDRVKATWIAGIAQEKARPNGAALRVLPPLLYGEGHPYAIPLSGTGTEASIAALTRDDLVAYRDAYVRPEGATLIVVGDTTMAEIKPALEAVFGKWQGKGEAPKAGAIPAVERPAASRVFLIDQPGAIQANIFAGQLMPSTKDPATTAFDFANTVLGGQFSARLNMNLREDKHWAYGAYSFTQDALGQRPWLAFAPVQIDKTVPALQEIAREVGEFASGKAPTSADEVEKVKASEIRGLPGAVETARAVMGAIGDIVQYGRPDDYVTRHAAEIKALTVEQVAEAAKAIDPDALTWVVVGDLSKIEQPIRDLALGEVTVIDADGKARP
ncbi:pitrilysin family protein [Luteimonas sp. 8-5]|uniref:M16 family metallopeptidase n=1 Tax=Luteimonas sp. 8-5 TaxID=3039387 RepID=UPI002436E57A|nr:pitrilysin family protein [Luteimonas sp. 8-5]MDG6348780.1 pitrilysin family protein [Luteimonas sp. 8-5]